MKEFSVDIDTDGNSSVEAIKCNLKLGRNAIENDTLVKNANQEWWWFHLDKLQSGHLILESGKEPDIATINRCAQIVKEHSKFKNIYRTTVIYTQVKNISRTGTPGLVIAKKTKKVIV